MSSLQIYLEYLQAKREWQETWLKSHGLNFTSLSKLRDEATSEMQSLGQDKVECGKYEATLESHPIRIAPDAGKVISTSYRISLHSKH